MQGRTVNKDFSFITQAFSAIRSKVRRVMVFLIVLRTDMSF